MKRHVILLTLLCILIIAVLIVPVTALAVVEGEKIIVADGATSPTFIIDSDLVKDGNITITITDLHQYVAEGNFTTANVIVSDNAPAAEWTGVVAGNTLTLTSTGGTTAKDETVTITFTGATNPWIAYTDGEKTVGLTAVRIDTGHTSTFNFTINTGVLEAGFSASPTSDYVPATIAFTDLSTGNPISWNWDFGDGATSTEQNPTHIYTQPGLYDVTMTVWNAYSMGLVSKTNYINILNVTVREADTSIAGLTISNCGGPQTIMVNTSILTAALSSGNSVLEIQAPAESGFKTIIFYDLDGVGFSQNDNLITGNPTGVNLVSEDIAPSLGFSSDIGTNASFYYSIDLPSYPCNSLLSTGIREGVALYYNLKFQQVAYANNVTPVGTAYTATITKTNFPSGIPAKIYMSVNSSWKQSLYADYIIIWRIADDETYGQILPTSFLYSDPVTNLDYYEADSPLGLSTIGISATVDVPTPVNPFQMIVFAVANVVNGGSDEQSSSESTVTTNAEQGSPNSDQMQGGPVQEPAPGVPKMPEPLSRPAMTTNIGMAGWVLSTIRQNLVVLVIAVAVIAGTAYFGWWKRRL